MRLLFMAKYPYWHRNAWGGDRHTHALAEHLADMGHDICFVTADHAGEHNNDGSIEHKELDNVWHRNRPFYPDINQLYDFLQKHPFDLIHHFSTMGYPIEHLRRKGKLTTLALFTLVTTNCSRKSMISTCGLISLIITMGSTILWAI